MSQPHGALIDDLAVKNLETHAIPPVPQGFFRIGYRDGLMVQGAKQRMVHGFVKSEDPNRSEHVPRPSANWTEFGKAILSECKFDHIGFRVVVAQPY